MFRSLLGASACLVCLAPLPRITPPVQTVSFQQLSEHDQITVVARALSPLLNAIADVEGGSQNLNAANRGRAGDTPGGCRSVLGRDCTGMTVAEVIQAQRWSVFAVGAYQFVPTTLRSLIQFSDFDTSRQFDKVTQQELAVLNIKYMRPQVWAYVLGEPVSAHRAALAMAKEWASIGHPSDDRSYYAGGRGNNKAKISTTFVSATLSSVRGTLAQPQVIR
jgi:hypothetical protein